MHRVILWFRNDLRIHDNAILNWAINQKKVAHIEFLPVFCFDPRFYDDAVPKFAMERKSGIIRTRFQLETVKELRESLAKLGSNLLVAHAKPETFLQKLVSQDMVNTVVYQTEICHEERFVEDQIKEQMESTKAKCQFVSIWGSTIHHIDDLPYDPVEYFPHVYGNMKKKQANVNSRPLLSSPTKGQLPFKLKCASTEVEEALTFLPDLKEDFKFTDEEI